MVKKPQDPEYFRKYYLRNKEKRLAQSKARNATQRAEKAEYDKARREQNIEAFREYDRDRYAKARRWSVHSMLYRAKARAKMEALPFSITKADIVIPETCPALGIPLYGRSGSGCGDNSPSLDKIIPSLGYIPGNVIVISAKANMIKRNACAQDILDVALWLFKITKSQPKPL